MEDLLWYHSWRFQEVLIGYMMEGLPGQEDILVVLIYRSFIRVHQLHQEIPQKWELLEILSVPIQMELTSDTSTCTNTENIFLI